MQTNVLGTCFDLPHCCISCHLLVINMPIGLISSIYDLGVQVADDITFMMQMYSSHLHLHMT